MVSVPSRIFTKMNSSTEHDRIIFVIMIIKIFQNIYYIFSHCYSDCYVQNTVSKSLTLVWRHNKNIDPLIPKNCRAIALRKTMSLQMQLLMIIIFQIICLRCISLTFLCRWPLFVYYFRPEMITWCVLTSVLFNVLQTLKA